MHMYNFLCSDSLLYTSFFFFLLYMVFIHVIVHAIFQSNCAEGLHFSAFHYNGKYLIQVNYYMMNISFK